MAPLLYIIVAVPTSKLRRAEANREFRRLGLKRLFLHALETRFRHPRSGETLRFEAPLAPELRLFLESLPR